MENFHTVCHDGFQHRNAGGQRRKNRREEEQCAHKRSRFSHRVKDLRQRDEHQARTRAHALNAGEDIDRRNDHNAREQRHQRVKQLDLVDRFSEVHVLFYIRAVGDHDAHRHAQREEQLTHRVEQNLQKPLDGQALDVRRNKIQKALQPRARHAVCVRIFERQRIPGNHNHQHQQHRHHEFRHLFNAAFHAVIDNQRRRRHKQKRKHDRRNRRGDKAHKIAVLRRGAGLPGHIDELPGKMVGLLFHDICSPCSPFPEYFPGAQGLRYHKTFWK